MKKVTQWLVVLITVIVVGYSAIGTGALAQAAGNIRIFINGREGFPSIPPTTMNGSTMVSLRFVAESLGATVDWDINTQSVLITGGDTADAPSKNALVRNMFPDVPVRSAYLSIAVPDTLSQQQQQAIWGMLASKELEMFDGLYIIFESANGQETQKIIIHGSDIVAWETKAITEDEFLNRWEFLARREDITAVTAPAPSAPLVSSSSAVIESKIDGDFTGWEGETVFKLMNGQIWQQDSYNYTYHYAYMPEVVIYPSGSRYKMKVEGVDDTIYVIRLK